MVVVWNTSQVTKGGQVFVVSKAHTDVDIERMRIASFDDTRSVAIIILIETYKMSIIVIITAHGSL